MIRIIGYITLFITLFSCSSRETSDPLDKIIASVSGKNLYLSEVNQLYPQDATTQDSLNIRTQFIDKWIRDNIVLSEAEKYISNEIDIDQLVEDYRSSLLVYNYEERLVKERLDTVITQAQKISVYEANKSSYLLTSDILKGISISVPVETPELNGFKKSWISQDLEALRSYCQKYQLNCRVIPDKWRTFADFFGNWPENLFSKERLLSGKALDKERGGIQYFVKVDEHRDKNTEAPLEYIEDKIEKVILYNRKVNLLKTIKQKLYERDLDNNKVKIYEEHF